MRIGLDPTYPPFEIAEGDAVYGLDVDLAHAIADDLGLSLEYVFFGFDGLYDGLSTDQVDVLISALVLAPEKTKDFAFTNSYFDAGQMLVTPLGSQIYEMTHLRGRSVATELGAQGHVIANNWKTIVPDLTIITFNSVNDALQAVTRGDTDAALADSVSARLFRQNEPGLQIADMPVTNEPYVLVVRAADEVLLKQLNGSIDRLQQSGILENIVAKWLDS